MVKNKAAKPQSHDWARFWSVDFHVHTPGSADAAEQDFGTPEEIVQAAVDAGLDAIVVTDHNTASWVTRVGAAAANASLVVLPGVELSTRDGHLLGIWEEGTDPAVIEDVLVAVGFPRAQHGAIEKLASQSMGDCAGIIRKSGGIAVAAHVDKEKGFMSLGVPAYVNEILADDRLAGLEYVLDETPAKIEAKLKGASRRALVQGSDTYDPDLSRHSLTGIGKRRTWIKASRPDLRGIVHALEDPELRVALVDPSDATGRAVITSLSIEGGFLSGTAIPLSPDLNCLLGGTGSGKSLTLEAVRFALDQQIDSKQFAAIRVEVDRRLAFALPTGSTVTVDLLVGGEAYRVIRTNNIPLGSPSVEQLVHGVWVRIERTPDSLVKIAAFSQGEILEYARQTVGRVGLIDAHLDLAAVDKKEADAKTSLLENSRKLMKARDQVESLEEDAKDSETLESRERELSKLFSAEIVQKQSDWAAETSQVKVLAEQVDSLELELSLDLKEVSPKFSQHNHEFERINAAKQTLNKAVEDANSLVDTQLRNLQEVINSASEKLDKEHAAYTALLDAELEKSGGRSTKLLRAELSELQAKLAKARTAKSDLEASARPALDMLTAERENLLVELKATRDERRSLRRGHAERLNSRTAGFVKVDLPSKGDTSEYRAMLDRLKVGSRVREGALNLIAQHIHPFSLVRSLWTGDFSKIGKLVDGLRLEDLSRLHTNIADNKLWGELLKLQAVDCPDTLRIKFKKPEGQAYVEIEDLSHGQKCTAILIVLMADGDSPVLIDQPEDALHAPWIEEYLVKSLRDLRGTRQYIFATRSPGLVVSADSEQLVTMRADASKGGIEATGSLERHDLNKLALHHLEGGRVPFDRRAKKLHSAIGG